jgi:putative oxidoreductase
VGAGLLELVAGIALVIGFQARWAALALGVFTLLASVLFHAYWAAPRRAGVRSAAHVHEEPRGRRRHVPRAALGAGPFSIDARRAAA